MNKHDVHEANYIKLSTRKDNEKKHNHLVQRIVSTLIIVFVIAFLAISGIDMVSATSNAYVIVVDDIEVATMVSENEADQALALCVETQEQQYSEEYTFSIYYTNDVEIKEISAVGVVYSSIEEASELLIDHLDLMANAVVLMVDGEKVLYVGSEKEAIEAVSLAKNHFGSVNDEDIVSIYTTEQISLSNASISVDHVYTAEDAADYLIYGSLDNKDKPNPLITVNVQRQSKVIEPLPYDTIRIENDEMARGQEEIVTAGVDGTQEVTYIQTESNGVIVEQEQLSTEVIVAAVDEVVEIGTKLLIYSSRSGTGDAAFLWPVANGSGVVTSRFGWRSRGWHSGVDLAAPVGTMLLAAESGTVVVCEYQSGYGNVIYIDHGNGVQTRYAHNDEMFVSVGDYVERGAGICTIGMTGTTTGPHVHFEIRIDGTAVDPLPYIE